MKGTFKWFNRRKGYGFICGEDSQDIFVHITEMDMAGNNRIQPGQPVEYDIGEKDGKSVAVNVKLC